MQKFRNLSQNYYILYQSLFPSYVQILDSFPTDPQKCSGHGFSHGSGVYVIFTAEPNHIPKVKKTVTYIVMAVLFDDKDRVVLVQEAKSSCRGSWYLPAGRVEKGENLVVSLIFSHLVRKQVWDLKSKLSRVI